MKRADEALYANKRAGKQQVDAPQADAILQRTT
jgi:hypothetical protein